MSNAYIYYVFNYKFKAILEYAIDSLKKKEKEKNENKI